MNQLKKMTKLWLAYNQFATIPEVLLDLAKPGVILQLCNYLIMQMRTNSIFKMSQI